MATSLWNLLGEYKVVIPLLQRDYAQGRQTLKVNNIRDRFLTSLFNSIEKNNDPLELDFVYGYTKEYVSDSNIKSKQFVPLDGQQRLTTLFLLHWFVSVKEGKMSEAQSYLSNFTYETRHSSRVFCEKLVKFQPDDFTISIKETIINQPWFFTAWKNDPTILSMLTMLDAIQERVKKMGSAKIWPLLISDKSCIVFHLLPMEKLGLPDDLYIKMNSRGKELTEFEHFKSSFSEILSPEHKDIFNTKIDQVWSDLFWNLYRDQDSTDPAKGVDSAFLCFFSYITDILIAKNSIVVPNQNDYFANYQVVYENQKENVEFLFSSLDVFQNIYHSNIDFFGSIFYTNEKDFSVGKTRLFFQSATADLFKKCAENYDSSLRVNLFSIGEQLLLYACILHLTSNTSDFNDRIRRLRNLITNSDDSVRNENMKSLLTTVSEIILNNTIDADSRFNKTQVSEELAKETLLQKDKSLKTAVFKLEDHDLLQGCLAVFKLQSDIKDYSTAFENVFTKDCNYETISMALFCFGDYSQDFGNWFTQLGSKHSATWRELFTPSNRKVGLEKTKDVMYLMLSHLIQNPSSNLESIIDNYLSTFDKNQSKPKDWIYYFVKYPEFRKHEGGFYYWATNDKPYQCLMMRRTQLNGWHWSPFLYAINERATGNLSMGEYGAPLVLVKNNSSVRIFNLNTGYKIEVVDPADVTLIDALRKQKIINSSDMLEINQNNEGIDIEDRIEKGIELISKIIKD